MVERLEEVIGNLEAALARHKAENARLRLVEAAAADALAELEALLIQPDPAENAADTDSADTDGADTDGAD
jgi:hypothetical protein